jgi:hypothetical protein
VTILPVSFPPATVFGSGFPAQALLTFDADPALGVLSINAVNAGLGTSPQCTAPIAVDHHLCTPLVAPFLTFENTPGGGSSARFIFFGTASDGSPWVGTFTSQFGMPFQQVLGTLFIQGSISSAYSATFRVVPEPSTGLLVTAGVLGLAIRRRRNSRRGA